MDHDERLKQGIDALRAETAPEGAKERLLQRLSRPRKRVILPRIGVLVAAAAAILVVTLNLLPQSASARLQRVAGALGSTRTYTIRSYGYETGTRVLYGITEVLGEEKKVTMFDKSGKPLPDALTKSVLDSVAGHVRKGYLNKPDEGDGSTKISTAIFEGSKMIGPAVVKGFTFHAPNGKRFFVYTGLSTVGELDELLELSNSWELKPNVMYGGRRLDDFHLKETTFHVYVDPRTDLPAFVRIQDCEDAYDFGSP